MSINQRWRWAGVVLAGIATGVLAARPIVAALVERSAVRAGAWRTSVATGSVDANLYERAAIAVAGLYALSKDETVYYTAFTDSAGVPLDGRCDYRLAGEPLPSRWWSLTLYGDDHYLVDNPARIYSRHAGNLEFDPAGAYVITVSAQSQPRNWLPAPASGAFSITARLYNPDPAIRRDPTAVALPRIERGACR